LFFLVSLSFVRRAVAGEVLHDAVFKALAGRLGVENKGKNFIIDSLMKFYGVRKNEINRAIFFGVVVSEIDKRCDKGVDQIVLEVVGQLEKQVPKIIALKKQRRRRSGSILKSIFLLGLGCACSGVVFYLLYRKMKNGAEREKKKAVRKKKEKVKKYYEELLEDIGDEYSDLEDEIEALRKKCKRLEGQNRKLKAYRDTVLKNVRKIREMRGEFSKGRGK